MSFINNNLFASSFPATGEPGGQAYQVPSPPGLGSGSDTIAPSPWGPGGFGLGSANGETSSFGSIMNSFMSAISGLMGQLGSLFGFSSSQPNSQSCTPGQNCAPAQQGGEQYFTSASGGSVGDPHDSFTATSGTGATVGGKWDNMQSHGDLLSSNSFAGGYRVSTTATQPNQKGITYNSSATITTNRGGTSVTMNADGSYAVTANGQNVALQQGSPLSLGNGETVTLGTDGSLTVNDQNTQGGSLSTVLKSNGAGGVDVNSSASNVDLGGYLVRRTDGAAGNQQPFGGVNFPEAYGGVNFPQPQPVSGGLGSSSLSSFSAALDGTDLDQIAESAFG